MQFHSCQSAKLLQEQDMPCIVALGSVVCAQLSLSLKLAVGLLIAHDICFLCSRYSHCAGSCSCLQGGMWYISWVLLPSGFHWWPLNLVCSSCWLRTRFGQKKKCLTYYLLHPEWEQTCLRAYCCWASPRDGVFCSCQGKSFRELDRWDANDFYLLSCVVCLNLHW